MFVCAAYTEVETLVLSDSVNVENNSNYYDMRVLDGLTYQK